MQYKKRILIDLDGVLNEYKGKFDANIIPEPKKGTEKFLKNLSQNYELVLFTTRNRIQASKWLIEYNLDKYISDITNVKELSWLMIDDRCLRFEGDFEKLNNQINSFAPWYK